MIAPPTQRFNRGNEPPRKRELCDLSLRDCLALVLFGMALAFVVTLLPAVAERGSVAVKACQ